MRSRVMLFPLFTEYRVVTTGVALAETTLDLDVPGFKSILPHCEALYLITHTRMISTNPLEWNVRCIAGFDRAKEAPPFNISPTPFSAAGNGASTTPRA